MSVARPALAGHAGSKIEAQRYARRGALVNTKLDRVRTYEIAGSDRFLNPHALWTADILAADRARASAHIYRVAATEIIDGVLVSGAGPVGLVTALKLAHAGIRVVVVDSEPAKFSWV
jgi:hypothetical protein